MTSIDRSAFEYCKSLATVCNYAATPQTLGSYAFNEISESAILYVPDESVDAYTSSSWNSYFSQVLPLSEYNPTGIEEIHGQNASIQHIEGIYSISGARRTSLQKGLNIIGSKKVLVK